MKRLFQLVSILLFTLFMVCCKSYSKYTIDEKPLIKIDTGLLGIWRAIEDTDKANFILVQNNYDVKHRLADYNPDDYSYYITYMDRHGKNPHFQQFATFISEIENIKFLNVLYHYTPYVDHHFIENESASGYFFVRLIDLSADHRKITTAIIADTTLKDITSSKEVKTRIMKNINNPTFYSDTLHFYKVSGFHESLNESKSKVN
jgi:hypothetical protein